MARYTRFDNSQITTELRILANNDFVVEYPYRHWKPYGPQFKSHQNARLTPVGVALLQYIATADWATPRHFTKSLVADPVDVLRPLPRPITATCSEKDDQWIFLEYGTVDDEAVGLLEAFAERHPHAEEVTLTDPTSDPIQFQLRLVEPPVISVVASHGGYIEHATFQDGDLRLTVHLPPTVPVRRVIDAIEAAYPGTTLVTKRQLTRDEQSTPLHRTLTGDLTDRQQAALEAAVFSGYFDWPREVSGVDIADSLGVSPPTFHQHLRKAQKKLFESLYPATAPA
jgi:predicted DNA binding protein